MKKFVDLYCDFDDFCKVFIPQWPKQLLEDGIAKEVKERWDDFMDLCFTLSLIIKLVTTGNVHDTQPVAELARGLTD